MDNIADPGLQKPTTVKSSPSKVQLRVLELREVFAAQFGAPELELPWRRIMKFWQEHRVKNDVAYLLMLGCVLPLCNRYWVDITGGRKGFVLVKRGNEDDSSSSTDVGIRRVKWQEKSYEEFEKHTYRKFVLDSGKGGIFIPAKAWRDWEGAKTAPGYDMIGPMCRASDRLGAEVFNIYGGMAVDLDDARRNGDASDTGHGALFQRFVEDGLCKLEGKEVGQRLYQWLACVATRPGWRSNVAVCIFGIGGAGRSTVGTTMRRIMGDTLSTSVSNAKVVVGDFNGVIKHKQFTVLEEVVLRDESGMNRMKDLIDGASLAVRNLYSEVAHFRNTNNYLINNNYPDSLRMDYEGVRKFLCIYTDGTCGFRAPEWADQWRVLQEQLNYRDVLARMIQVAETLPKGFEPSANLPRTKGMELQKKSNDDKRQKDPVKGFLEALLSGEELIVGLSWGGVVPGALLYQRFCLMYKVSHKVLEAVNTTQSLTAKMDALLGKLKKHQISHGTMVKRWGWEESQLLTIKSANYRCVQLPSAEEAAQKLGLVEESEEDDLSTPPYWEIEWASLERE